MSKKLAKQVERIMDETGGAYADVIVQFGSEQDEQLRDMLEAVVETERSRAMIIDPTQIMPPEAKTFDSGKIARRKLMETAGSLAAQMLSVTASPVASEAVGLAVKAFLDSDDVQQAVSDVQRRLRSKADRAKPTPLTNIGGARIMVNRGALPKLIEESDDRIEGVYANSRIKTPRLAKATAAAAGVGAYDSTTWGLEHTRALSSWSAFGTRGVRNGQPIRVAVLDTGVDATHPDLQGKIADFAEFDNSGAIISNAPRDSGSHGTHVAGTVVGGNASGGWIGMAPDAELICGLVLNGAAGGTLAQVIGGIDWAVSQGALAINLSLGGLTFDPDVGTPYQRAIVDALVRGSLVIAAIGNDGSQTTGAPGNDYFSLAVAAHDANARCAGFSGGRTHILSSSQYISPDYLPLVYMKPDVSAPGVAVKSCVPNGSWDAYNGTSMATPHVTGAAALLFAATGVADRPAQQRAFLARDLLIGGVDDAGEAGQDQRHGYGSINVLRSIDAALARGYR